MPKTLSRTLERRLPSPAQVTPRCRLRRPTAIWFHIVLRPGRRKPSSSPRLCRFAPRRLRPLAWIVCPKITHLSRMLLRPLPMRMLPLSQPVNLVARIRPRTQPPRITARPRRKAPRSNTRPSRSRPCSRPSNPLLVSRRRSSGLGASDTTSRTLLTSHRTHSSSLPKQPIRTMFPKLPRRRAWAPLLLVVALANGGNGRVLSLAISSRG